MDAFAVVVWNGLEAETDSDMISMGPQAVAWSVSTTTKAALQALHCCSWKLWRNGPGLNYPLVMTNIAIENGPFIVVLPIKNGDFP